MKKAIFIFSICFIFNAYANECAEDVVRCGTTDDGLSWEISNIKDENGQYVRLSSGEIAQQLSITGTGNMQDYSRHGEGIAPWKDPNYLSSGQNSAPTITSVVIGDGITSVGKSAFEDMESVQNLSLPNGLKKIKNEAFNACPILELNLPDSLEEIGSFAFSSTRASEIILPKGVEKIGSAAFYNTPHLLSITIPENTNVDIDAFAILDGRHDALIFIQNIYCAETNTSCQALKNNSYMKDKVQYYESDGGIYFSGNKWYANVHDIGTPNYIKKRIYTIDEANKVAGDKNRVSIRYR